MSSLEDNDFFQYNRVAKNKNVINIKIIYGQCVLARIPNVVNAIIFE
jgi:hypothetical protein